MFLNNMGPTGLKFMGFYLGIVNVVVVVVVVVAVIVLVKVVLVSIDLF